MKNYVKKKPRPKTPVKGKKWGRERILPELVKLKRCERIERL